MENIAPYTEEQAKEAFLRISKDPQITNILNYISPEADEAHFRGSIANLKSIDDFKTNVMYSMVETILAKSSSGVTYSNVSALNDGHSHLILSNHRDIILDPAILQTILFDNNIPMTEIAVGDNLLSSQLVEDIMRSNGMITVVRDGTPRERYSNSLNLSNYLRGRISNEIAHIWIANRNGRTKDGIDTTSQGLLKMLGMSGSNGFFNDFSELRIVPLAISYEFEPCDFLKARELYISEREKYVKSPGEDLRSIITGVKQFKGKIHYSFNSTISVEELEYCSQFDKNERFQALSTIIDKKIHSSYRLWSNNYIAADLLNKSDRYLGEFYSSEQRGIFVDYMERGLSNLVEKESFIEKNDIKRLFLSIYANPLSN